MVTYYVVGFWFNNARDRVALIRKIKPEWQKGLLNGVGGKVEGNESFRQAMVREFQEETGVETIEGNWTLAIEQRGENYFLAVFHGKALTNVCEDFIKADEQVEWYNVKELLEREDLIKNLPWFITLAFDKDVKLPLQVFTS